MMVAPLDFTKVGSPPRRRSAVLRWGRAGALVASLSCCSLVLDKNANQCSSNSDCAVFGGHPFCQSNVCVSSGLGPAGCFFGQPSHQADFANQCSTAAVIPFDDCGRLAACNATSAAQVFLVDAGAPSLGAIPPLINPETPPTISCTDPSRPNLIYVAGSTSFSQFVQAVQPLLSAATPAYTVVFLPASSCAGAAAVFDRDPSKHVIQNQTGNWAFFYDGNGNQTYCLLDSEGNTVDVGESDVAPVDCGYQESAGVADYPGPLQAFSFVVPSGSSQQTISAEAAHLVFGAGGNGGAAAPWTDPTLYFIRASNTGSILLTSPAIGVASAAWWGIDRISDDNLRDSMEAVDPTRVEGAIGVLSTNVADPARANLRELAFQAQGQLAGYLPDSTPVSLDKGNVRDGHYPIWGTIHLFASIVTGVPSQAADALVTRFTVPKLDQTLITAIIGAGYVPACAMKVVRHQEMGPLASIEPKFDCGCYFTTVVDGASSCTSCKVPADCPSATPSCNYGFCEIQ